MITNEMLQVVAEYDGWVNPAKFLSHLWVKGQSKQLQTYELLYTISMDWLHPVAMKLLKSLQCEDKGDLPSEFWNVVNCCSLPPVDGQYIDLFNAVYEAILFIKQNKETCNTN